MRIRSYCPSAACLHLPDSDLAILGRFHLKARFLQDLHCDLTVQLVVLYQQDVPALEVGVLFRQKLLRRIRLCLADALIRVSRRSDMNMGLEQKAVTPAAFASTSMSDQS